MSEERIVFAPDADMPTADASVEDESTQLEGGAKAEGESMQLDGGAGGEEVAADESAKDKSTEDEHVDADNFEEADVTEIEELLRSTGKDKEGEEQEEEEEGNKVGGEDEMMEEYVDLSVEAKVSACKVASAELDRMDKSVVTINGEEISYEQKLLIADMRVDSCKRAPQIRTETTTFGMVLDEVPDADGGSYKQLRKNRDEQMTAGEATELLSRLVTSINQGKQGSAFSENQKGESTRTDQACPIFRFFVFNPD